MTPPKLLPALLIAHDPLAERAVGRAQWVIEGAGSGIVCCTAAEFTGAIAEPALTDVGAYDAFLVIHIVGPLEDPGLSIAERGDDPVGALETDIAAVHETLHQRFPGKHRIDQWVIHAVGQVVDESETRFIERIAKNTNAGLRGLVVSASATHASVTHDDDEQAGFAADIAMALIGSDVEHYLANSEPTAWIAGTTSLAYSAARMSESISAFHALRILEDHLLADSPPGDPALDIGEQWVDDLDLASTQERDLLLSSPTGGSLLARVRMGEIDWATVPVTSWSDVLTTHQTLVANQQLGTIRDVIEKNRLKRVGELKASVIGAMFEELEESVRFESAIAFCTGVQAGLEKALAAIPDPERTVDPELVDQDRAKLRRFTRWLPFGPAVALRVLAFALGIMVVVRARTGPANLPILRLVPKPWGYVAALLILVCGLVLYLRRRNRTLAVRDRLKEGLAGQLVDTVEQLVVEARREALVEVRAWIGSRPGWLDHGSAPNRPEEAQMLVEWVAWLVHESRLSRDLLLRRAVDRTDVSGISSRYAVDLPNVRILPTEELADQTLRDTPTAKEGAQTLVLHFRQVGTHTALRILDKQQLAQMWTGWLASRMSRQVWHGFGDLLVDQPSVRDSARETIESNTTPAIAAEDNAPSIRTSHYLAIDGAMEGEPYRNLFSPDVDADAIPRRKVTDSLTDVLDFRIPNVAVMVHLTSLDLHPAFSAGTADDQAAATHPTSDPEPHL